MEKPSGSGMSFWRMHGIAETFGHLSGYMANLSIFHGKLSNKRKEIPKVVQTLLLFFLSLCFFTPDPDQLTSTQIPRWRILQVI
ncbi:hypothetical protein V6N13_010984 [Hibiscus sabdariffa]